jgi:hypothetical protein
MLNAEMAYPVHEQELLALVKMCNRAAHMLRGTKFVANTDHHALIYLQKQVNLSGRQVRWIMELQLYDIQLKYVTGKLNTVADFLTRNPTVMPKCGDCGKVIVKTLTTNPIQQNLMQQIRKELVTNEWGQMIIKERAIRSQFYQVRTEEESLLIKQYSYRDGILRRNRKSYLPQGRLRTEILHRYHNIILAAHQGGKKTLEVIQRYYYWPSMRKDVTAFTQSCVEC